MMTSAAVSIHVKETKNPFPDWGRGDLSLRSFNKKQPAAIFALHQRAAFHHLL